MPEFKFFAVDKRGREVKGRENAGSMQSAVQRIRDRGLYPLKVTPSASGLNIPFFGRKGIKAKALALTTRQLATLLGAGLPLVRALQIIEEQQTQGYWRNALKGIIESIESGSSFSDALTRYRSVFSGIYINMVRAGESAGLLDLVLGRLADYFEKSTKLRNKVIAALVYPCLVLCAAILILTGLMVFVVPRFADMFADMGVALPVMTRILIGISGRMLTVKFWAAFAGTVISIKIIFGAVRRGKKGRYLLDKIKLKLPVAGRLVQKIAVSRFARTMSVLIASGVPILKAINIVRETVGNAVISKGLEMVHSSVKEGEGVSAPLRQVYAFDPVIINMIAVGEETGRLDQMLAKAADVYESEVDTIISGITSLLEPFLIIILACIVGFIVISLFLPLVKLLGRLAQG